MARCHVCLAPAYPPPEKCAAKACANDPKPPRATWPLPASEPELPDGPDPLSPLKKLGRDADALPQPPWPPPDDEDDWRGEQLPTCPAVATPGRSGSQLSDGISA
jgi:hypothetical protein